MQFPQYRLRELQHRLLGAYDAQIQKRYQILDSFSDSAYTTWYIRKGSVRIETEGKLTKVDSGNWVLFDPFIVRSHSFAPRTHLLSIRVQIEWRGVYALPPVQTMRVHDPSHAPGLHAAGLSLVEASKQYTCSPPSLESDCAFQVALLQWLSIWHPLRTRNSHDQHPERTIFDPRIHQILSILSERPGLGVIDYTALQNRVKLSRSQIDRLCRQQLGVTPRQWCERRTLAMAQHWLGSSNASIKEIAHRLQFVDASHFAKWMRRQTGQSPLQARAGI